MRVLVVDDDRSLATSVAHGLDVDGFAVDVAHDGADGLWFATECAYDVIVLDIMLPVLDGREVCRRIRERDVRTPVLMLTARTGEHEEIRSLDGGADDYLTKPFSYHVLLARLRALMRRGASVQPAVLAVGDLRLDPAARRVWRGDTEIELSWRQFAVLEFLIRRAGQVQSKLDILEHVWDFAYDGDPNIVEVYVHNLRKKVDAPFGRHAIVTVRRAGYRLAPDGG